MALICQVKRKVFVYESTTSKDVVKVEHSSFYTAIGTKLISESESDEDGFFQIKLEPGNYSLFIMEDGKYYANVFGGEDIIFPIRIVSGKVSQIRIDITYGAVF